MSEIVFLLEEPSAEAMLAGLLPRLLPPGIRHRCIVFEGKQDLDKQLVRRIRGYRAPGARFVVLRDQDSGDCRSIKGALQQKCAEARRPDSVVRIVCRELESWYLADLAAVESALGMKGIQRNQNRRPYRTPDQTVCPSGVLARIAPGYQKIGGSRRIGPFLDLNNDRSRSFRHFVSAVRRLAADLAGDQGV